MDDGKGMDLKDISKNGLSVAYSGKKEGVEDVELEEKQFHNYRDRIQVRKFFAAQKELDVFLVID